MSLFVQSLNNANTTGPGQSALFDEPKSKFNSTVSQVGSPTYTINLEYTIDNVNWFQGPTYNFGNPITSSGQYATIWLFPANPPIIFSGIRANLISFTPSANTDSVSIGILVGE